MPSDSLNQSVPTILLIAASRGLGLAMAAEFAAEKNHNFKIHLGCYIYQTGHIKHINLRGVAQ